MSDTKKGNKRYVGKLKTTNGNFGPYQKICMDNLNVQNKDGTPNTFYKGNLLWLDQETGKKYIVKQLGFTIPKNGMDAKSVEKGYSHFITIDIGNEYDTEELP